MSDQGAAGHKGVEESLIFDWHSRDGARRGLLRSALVVGTLAAVVFSGLRIRLGRPVQGIPEQAMVVLVPDGSGGRMLAQLVREEGPFPLRWHPGQDAELAAEEQRILEAEERDGTAYQPELAPPVNRESIAGRDGPSAAMVLPPLPASPPAAAGSDPRQITLGMWVVNGRAGGPRLEFSGLHLMGAEAVKLVGRRFLIAYQAGGRVREVEPLDGVAVDGELVTKIAMSRVLDTGGVDGWLVAECVIGE